MNSILSNPIFFLAALFEIFVGHLIWLWLKNDRHIWYGIIDGIILIFYEVVASLQTSPFGRVYAPFGGFLIIFHYWGIEIRQFFADKFHKMGSLVLLVGVGFIYYPSKN